ncbi:MAG: NAD(P)H-binding protein [Gaiellaceae bacterium]
MILVTGGTGFVGSHVVHALRALDHPVRALARKPEKQDRLRAWGVEVVQGDMTNAESLRRAIEGCEAVVHLVALPPFSGDEAVDRVMVRGTEHLVEAAKAAGVRRFVLMSALGTKKETQAVAPYYRGKWFMEEAVKGSGIDHTIFRPSFIFGRDGGMLPALLKLARYSPVMPVPSTRRLQPMWVDDVAAFYAAAVSDDAPKGTFEIAGPDQVSWNELYDRIRRLLGKRRLKLQIPLGVSKAAATAAQVLPPLKGARGAVAMLEHEDNVTDIGPAVEAFGIQPISLDDQIRRAAS